MKKRTVLYLFMANLAILTLLAFYYPHLMLAPGPLIEEHRELTTDCFACHAAFLGTPAQRCIACHRVDRIGLFTSKGRPIVKPVGKAAFHGKLLRQDCIACHGDHAGGEIYRRSRGHFSHGLLDGVTRAQCSSCHIKPSDSLHRKITGECSACHSLERWKPATFEHDKLFLLDAEHDVACATCHIANDYRKYTCYGCHDHTPQNMRAVHLEEGILDYANCVKCHRSSAEVEGHNESGDAHEDD